MAAILIPKVIFQFMVVARVALKLAVNIKKDLVCSLEEKEQHYISRTILTIGIGTSILLLM